MSAFLIILINLVMKDIHFAKQYNKHVYYSIHQCANIKLESLSKLINKFCIVCIKWYFIGYMYVW